MDQDDDDDDGNNHDVVESDHGDDEDKGIGVTLMVEGVVPMNGRYTIGQRERSGSVVECLTPDPGVAGVSLTSVTALCPWARHIYPTLVLVQPRYTLSLHN